MGDTEVTAQYQDQDPEEMQHSVDGYDVNERPLNDHPSTPRLDAGKKSWIYLLVGFALFFRLVVFYFVQGCYIEAYISDGAPKQSNMFGTISLAMVAGSMVVYTVCYFKGTNRFRESTLQYSAFGFMVFVVAKIVFEATSAKYKDTPSIYAHKTAAELLLTSFLYFAYLVVCDHLNDKTEAVRTTFFMAFILSVTGLLLYSIVYFIALSGRLLTEPDTTDGSAAAYKLLLSGGCVMTLGSISTLFASVKFLTSNDSYVDNIQLKPFLVSKLNLCFLVLVYIGCIIVTIGYAKAYTEQDMSSKPTILQYLFVIEPITLHLVVLPLLALGVLGMRI